MELADFIHLRVHTAYSLSAGAITIKELVARCRAALMPAVAITDSGNLFGALEFATACCAAGIQPIIGCEIALRPREETRRGAGGLTRPLAEPDRLVLLAQSEAGYRNLLALVSNAYLGGDSAGEPAVGLADLTAASDGLICLSGGPTGPLGRLLAEGQNDLAQALLDDLMRAFPDRLYIELMRHGDNAEARSEPALIDLAYRYDLPLVATNDAFFPDPDFYEAHDALLCIAQGKSVADNDRKRLTPNHYFRPAAEMRKLFADVPEACDNTLVIARRCAYIPMPRKPILPPFVTESGRSEPEELRLQALAGLEARLATQGFQTAMSEAEREAAAKPYFDRLEFELEVIV